MAINNSTLKDADGDYSDWIEIHNPATAPVNLNGWSLTDDATMLGKWHFPAVTIDGGGYLVVFASGKNRSVAGSELHTNFALNGDGEYLGPGASPTAAPSPPSLLPFQRSMPTFPTASAEQTAATLVATGAASKTLIPSNNTSRSDLDRRPGIQRQRLDRGHYRRRVTTRARDRTRRHTGISMKPPGQLPPTPAATAMPAPSTAPLGPPASTALRP